MTDDGVAVVVPMLNEASVLPRLLRSLASLDPPPDTVIGVDGGSTDGTVAAARTGGMCVIEAATGTRGGDINRAVAAVQSPIVCVLHADTLLPDDAITVIRRVLSDRRTALAGFTTLIRGERTVRWGTSFHNWIKTWYGPLLFRPRAFLRGGRLLFGDHAMFFRRADFLAVGGCDERLTVMEDADLCIRFSRLGRTRLINRIVVTSDRRIAAWGGLRANWIYLSVGVRWGLGFRRRLRDAYPDVR